MSIDFDQPDGNPEDSSNRLFIIIAVGLAGLIVLGLVAIGGVLMLKRVQTRQAIAQVTPPPTPTLAVVEQVPTATFTPTPLPALPTDTPTTTPTNTPVVFPTNTPNEVEATQTAVAQPEATNTPVPVGTPVGGGGDSGTGGTVPDTGVGGFGLVLIALGLVAVVIVSRRLRQAT